MSRFSRNPGEPVENLGVGQVIEVDGQRIVAELDPGIATLSRTHDGSVYPIGQFGSVLKIHCGRRLIYGYVSRLRMRSEYDLEMGIEALASPTARILEADLFGEGEWFRDDADEGKWMLHFERGVSIFPLPQQRIFLTPDAELKFIYGHSQGSTLEIGEHVGSGHAPALADMNELLGKHTAVLGSTGSGKSATVAAILHAILDRGRLQGYASWSPRILILDPHNEYGAAFKDHLRLSTDEGTLLLPYWLLDLHETISLLIGRTEFVATSQTNIIKSALLEARADACEPLGVDPEATTVDSPVPYSLDGFRAKIEAQRDKFTPSKQDPFNSILAKLETLRRDSRLAFLMTPWDGQEDPFADVLGQFTGDGHPIRIVDLSGVPNEVAGLASSAIARTLFSLKLWQTADERAVDPLLLVCEEAHRYVPNRGDAQYEAAQSAIRRLAKEGRKYGIGLMLVSQRPSEIEATVLSQCNSWVVMRITNDADREHVRAILPDSLAGLSKVLSALRRREALFVGQAAVLPSRIMIRELADDQLPRSHDIDFDAAWQETPSDANALNEIGRRWRTQSRPTGVRKSDAGAGQTA